MFLLKKQVRALPAGFKYTDMEPCKSRGMFKPYIYALEIPAAIYIMTLPSPAIWVGAVIVAHGLYRIGNMKRLQVACPHCHMVKGQLLENGKPFKCKSCGHRLGIYGTKVADLSGTTSPTGDATSSVPPFLSSDNAYSPAKIAGGVVTAVILIGYFFWLFGGGVEWHAEKMAKQGYADVAQETVVQYGIAKRSGNKIDQCAQAGLVLAAYLQASDANNYAKWRQIRDNDCAAAGIPY